jgi:low temperature requirement protein LtrA
LRFVFWGVGFLVELLTPFVNLAVVRRTPYDASHVPERFGLFTLIVIGEAVLTGVTGLAGLDWQLLSTIIGVCGFAIAASIWWIYYDFVETSGVRQGAIMAGQIYVYGHFPIAVGVAAIGVATQHAIKEATHPALSTGSRWLLCGGVALFLLTTVAIRLSARHTHLLWSRLTVSAIAIALAAFGHHLAPIVLVGFLLAALVTEVWLESVKKEQVAQSCALEEAPQTGKCTHLDQIAEVSPKTTGCEECLAGRYQWVHLRLCQICGHVGCCDSSKFKHATKHFEETGHPIIKSIEPGENWAWCYLDETYV